MYEGPGAHAPGSKWLAESHPIPPPTWEVIFAPSSPATLATRRADVSARPAAAAAASSAARTSRASRSSTAATRPANAASVSRSCRAYTDT